MKDVSYYLKELWKLIQTRIAIFNNSYFQVYYFRENRSSIIETENL